MHVDQFTEGKSYHRKRMLWYFDQMIDFLMANPGCKMSELGAHVNKAASTVSAIVNSDMFKARLSQRRQEFVKDHDFGLVQRSVHLAEKSMDLILEVLEKKKDQVPMGQLLEIQTSALERLGYGSKQQPLVQINQQNNSATMVNLPPTVDAAVIAEARMAVRQAQRDKILEHSRNAPLLDLEPVHSNLPPSGESAQAAEPTTPERPDDPSSPAS